MTIPLLLLQSLNNSLENQVKVKWLTLILSNCVVKTNVAYSGKESQTGKLIWKTR